MIILTILQQAFLIQVTESTSDVFFLFQGHAQFLLNKINRPV